MKIVVAPDSYKGNLSSIEVAGYIEAGIKKAGEELGEEIEVRKIPVADGGEGTVEAMVIATGGKIVNVQASGPFMEKVDSYFGVLGNGRTAVIEVASVAGLSLVPECKRNPLETTTYGLGELILSAIEYGCDEILIGIGGSSTNDGGMGMAQALGARFYDKHGNILGQGGKYLADVASVDITNIDKRLKKVKIITGCDVKNRLYGPEGAAYVFAPQKGATPEMVEFLDRGLRNYAEVIKRDLGIDIANVPGSGAAGGLGGGLIAFANSVMKPGIEIVIESCDFNNVVKDASLLITGEGKTDSQTAYGKVPVGLAAVAQKYNVPVVCISGGLGEGYEAIYKHGIDAAFSNVPDAMTLEEAMARSGEFLIRMAYSLARLIIKVERQAKKQA